MSILKIRDKLGRWINLISDSLSDDSPNRALSAKQGKILKDTKLDRPTGDLPANSFLRTDENGNIIWGIGISEDSISEEVSNWLEENIAGGQTLVVDKSLTVDGAAADAETVGQYLDELIQISDRQPSGTKNKIWLTETLGEGIEIPTMEDLQAVINELQTVENNIQGMGQGLSAEAKIALLACFSKVPWVDSHGKNYYDTLHDALFPVVDLLSIDVVFDQDDNIVSPSDTLESLKQYLSVTASYSDGTTELLSDYTLTGTLVSGTSSIITVTYENKTDTFSVDVSNAISSIIASLDLSGNIIYTSNTLQDLRQYITVTANYTDNSSSVISDYQLDGTLDVGSNTITVSYRGLTDTLTVTVYEPDTITAVLGNIPETIYIETPLNYLKQYLIVTYTHLGVSTELDDNSYVLDGTLIEGINTITVYYQGLNTTFTVEAIDDPANKILYKLPETTVFDSTNYIDTGLKLLSEDRNFTIVYDIYTDENVPAEGANDHRCIYHCMDEYGNPYPGISAWLYAYGETLNHSFNSATSKTLVTARTVGTRYCKSHHRCVVSHSKDNLSVHIYIRSYNFDEGTYYTYDYEAIPSNGGAYPVTEYTLLLGAERTSDGLSTRRYIKGTMVDFTVYNYTFSSTEAHDYIDSIVNAEFNPGSTIIYDTANIDDLKQYLTVTYTPNGSNAIILNDTDYTLEGTLYAGDCPVYIIYNDIITRILINIKGANHEIYTLPSITRFEKVSQIVDTNIQLMKSPMVFTIICELKIISSESFVGGNNQIVHCASGISPYEGLAVRYDKQNGLPKLRFQMAGSTTAVNVVTGTYPLEDTVRFVAIVDTINGTAAFYAKTTSTEVWVSVGNTFDGFTSVERTMVVGGYRNYNANTEHSFARSANSIVSEFKLYDRLFTDEEAREYVGGVVTNG